VTDIFDFWANIGPEEHIHPADRAVMERAEHGFDLRCLPAAFSGPLRTAPVVLLYLSFGFSPEDVAEGQSEAGRARYVRMRRGNEPLSGPGEHVAGHKWWSSRTRLFGEWDKVRHKVAVLNIGAYHSHTFEDAALLAALPSSRVSLDWAQSVLFEQAEAGERVVVCMRATKFWGLALGRKYGRSLYAPRVTRSGHFTRADTMRDEAVAAARALIG
jgi:hypothetical protein